MNRNGGETARTLHHKRVRLGWFTPTRMHPIKSWSLLTFAFNR